MKYYVFKLPYKDGSHQYPANYEETMGGVSVDHVYYDDEVDGLFSLLLAIPDEKAIVKPLPQNVSEVTEAQATTIADKYEPKVQIIKNEAVVRQLEIKSRLGMTLSSDELKALDPAQNIGFGISENFNDRMIKAKALKVIK